MPYVSRRLGVRACVCVCVCVHVFLRLTMLSLPQGKIVMFLNYVLDRKSYTFKLLKEKCVVCTYIVKRQTHYVPFECHPVVIFTRSCYSEI